MAEAQQPLPAFKIKDRLLWHRFTTETLRHRRLTETQIQLLENKDL